MKLGLIAPADFQKKIPFGGAEGFISHIVGKLGCQVIIFGIGINGTAPWNCVNLDSFGSFIAVSDLRYPSAVPMRLKALASYSLWRNRILRSGVDLLYIHSPECALPFLFFNDRIPVVFHQHGAGNPLSMSKYNWSKGRLLQGLFDLILKIVHKRADWTIAVDRLCCQQAKRHGVSHKISLLMNAVNKDKFCPDIKKRKSMRKKYKICKEKFVILYAGRLEKVKRVDRLIEAAQYLNVLESSFKIFIAGDGTLRSNLENIASQLNLKCRMNFLGQLPHNELAAYYNMADVLILPSEMEGTPMVVLEALSCGTPVIASKVGGISDLIENGENGILLSDPSPQKIASAIVFIQSHPKDREFVMQSVSSLGAEYAVRELECVFQAVLKNRYHNPI